MPISQILLISTTSGGGGGGGDGLAPPTTFTPDVDTSGIVTSGWQILMATTGLKTSETLSDPFARIGTTGFREANFQSSGAITRTAFGDGGGVYANFFLKTGITKIALVDGSGTLSDPTSNTNYLIYDLVSSTGSETIYDIIRRLDYYLQTNTPFHTNDTVYGSPAVTNFTAGANGYSGLLTSNGGSGFRDNDGDLPDKFVIMGINREADNDIQALCSYSGNLLSGKGDQWRNNNPLETFWSYWGNDFHANSQQQRPGREKGTNPGIGDGVASYTGPVYLLAFSGSIQPTYTLTPDADNVDEGSTLTFNVGGTNIVNGTYYWTMETSAGDFGANNGLVTITNNEGSFTVTPDTDTTTEGAETFTVSLRADSIAGDILVTSDPVTINDTSLTPEPTYTLTPAADNVDEGSSLEFTVGGTNISDGNYSWVIETGFEDFTTTFGTVTVTSNSGTFSVTPTADDTTEGPGSFTVSLRTGLLEPNLVTSDSVTINDTSLTPEPTYQIAPRANNVNEGSSLIIDVSGTNIPDDTYFWTVETNAGDFGTSSGEVEITNNAGSFTVTPDADATTEGSETFTVSLRSVSITGTVLATTDNDITINDTSLDPEPPFSLQFNQPQGDYLSTPASTDWNLGTSWTIEFWLNANSSGDGSANMTGGIWGLLNQEGWAATNAINIAISDSKLVVGQGAQYDDVRYTEPTPAQWTHVAIVNDAGTQKVFYNGVEQTKVSGTFGTANYTNSTDSLAIGNISGGNNYFDGKMAMVRISNTAKYAAAFTSTVTYGVESDTRLFLDLGYPLSDTSYYELNGVSVVTNTLTTIYISKSAYPNLDKQVRVGNTVTNTSDSTTCIVTAAVFTADPSNWGVDVSPGWSGVATVNFTGARHTIVNNGTTVSEEFPNTFTGLVHPYSGGTLGATYCLVDDPRLAEATAIPVGARITSNIAGFGTRTVIGNQVDFNGGRTITYDNTGLTGNTSTSHVFNFYW